MPIYEFQCERCGHVFDRLQKLSDPDPDRCPACAEQTIRRRLTAPAFRLSGSGWYETDFKKDGDRKRNLTEKGDSAAGESRPEAKSENKPDARSDPKPAVASDAAAPAKPAAKAEPKPTPPPAQKSASE